MFKLKFKIFILKLIKDNSDEWQNYYQFLNMELFSLEDPQGYTSFTEGYPKNKVDDVITAVMEYEIDDLYKRSHEPI